ncbi:hypothetical protein V3Q90_00050 [Flavobacterium oreochromis]|uniref:Prepilin-type N-terminal cleavage/methylation domain-containing protein n=1 Tax=Flavobacterium oreochromis TaxID=2906078 RepID=A0ABW8P5S9_9FLAO|nr:hypothetical protein [Flavobacterium oreochromis]OWP78974.1 hypothetical protein BWG23_00045 [Flavobacterium oreochromis]POR30749.1 hypothetical protein BWK58_00150 [Flavobacterium columnare]
MKINKLNAFSIIEAIIAMVIASIIISITFVIFNIISERLLDYKRQNLKTNDLNRLTYSINKDIFDSDHLNLTDNRLHFNNYTGEQLDYLFEESKIIRFNKDFIDTFYIQPLHYQMDTVKSKSEHLVFQKLKIQINSDSIPVKLAFYKQLFPNQLIEKKF